MQIREQKRSRNARRHFPLPPKSLKKTGDPGMTRTCDLRFRKPSLYPAELRDRRTPARGQLKILISERSCIRHPDYPRIWSGVSAGDPRALLSALLTSATMRRESGT